MVNDVSAATEDPAIVEAACSAGAALVLMHRLHAPGDDRVSTEADPRRRYGDVVRDVRDWLGVRVDAALRAGLPRECIAVDPGLGFGKDVAQNMELLVRLGEFVALGVPVLVGASRKSFLGAVAGEPNAARRDAASVVAAPARPLLTRTSPLRMMRYIWVLGTPLRWRIRKLSRRWSACSASTVSHCAEGARAGAGGSAGAGGKAPIMCFTSVLL